MKKKGKTSIGLLESLCFAGAVVTSHFGSDTLRQTENAYAALRVLPKGTTYDKKDKALARKILRKDQGELLLYTAGNCLLLYFVARKK